MNAVDVMQGWVNILVDPLGREVAQILFASLGLLILGVTVWGLRRGKIGVYRSAGGVIVTIFLGALAVDPTLLQRFAHITFLDRIRLVMGVISFLVLFVTFESVRRSHLQERYALLWVSTGLIILLTALFTGALNFFCAFLGMQYVTFVVAVIFTFLLLVAFHFSIALSSLSNDRSRLAQRVAQLEARLDALAGRPKTDPPSDSKSP